MTRSSIQRMDLHDIVKGCPCFKESDGEMLCMNNDQITTIEYIPLEPELLTGDSIGKGLLEAKSNNACFQLLRIETEKSKLVCISKGKDVVIKNRLVNPIDLIDAVEMLTGKSHGNHANVCNECLYGFLENLSSLSTCLDM